jgi:hypothetical protein
MTNKFTETNLDAAILALEIQQIEQAKQLKTELQNAWESVQPVNLIKNTLEQVNNSSELKDNLWNTAVGLGAVFLTKKVFVARAASPAKKIIGAALMFGITNLVAKNPGVVRAMATGIVGLLRRVTTFQKASKMPENDSENII